MHYTKKHVFGVVHELFFHDRTPFLSYRSLQIPPHHISVIFRNDFHINFAQEYGTMVQLYCTNRTVLPRFLELRWSMG